MGIIKIKGYKTEEVNLNYINTSAAHQSAHRPTNPLELAKQNVYLGSVVQAIMVTGREKLLSEIKKHSQA